MFTEEHLQLFTSFRVRTFGHKIQEMLDDPDYDDVSFEHKIVEALEAEQLARTNRKIEKYLKATKLKNPGASVENIHYRPDRQLSRERINRLTRLRWIDEPVNVVIIAATGAGKSYLAQALGTHACRNLHSVAYWRLSELATQLELLAGQPEKRHKLLTAAINSGVLILDDFFTMPISMQSTWALFEILEGRDGKAPTVIASQLEPEDWYRAIDDSITADSLLNRLSRPALFLRPGAPNMRPEHHEPNEY
jgi:DNA replication protein DnaC